MIAKPRATTAVGPALAGATDEARVAGAARRAAWRLLLSSALFALMAAGAKRATHRLPGAEVALVRFGAGIVATAVAVVAGRAVLRPRRWGWLLSRGLFGGASVVLYFASIQRVPVGVATLLNQTQPVFTMLCSWLLLREVPRRHALAALAFTLAGVSVIVGMRHLTFHGSLGEVLGVLSAIGSGIAVTSIRAARRERDDGVPPETTWSVFFSFTFLGALVTLPNVLSPFGAWVPPSPGEWALLAGVAGTSVGAQLIMTQALRHLTGVQSGIIAQLTVPMAVALGIVFLGETLTPTFLFGAALTLSGVMLTILSAPARRVETAPTNGRASAPTNGRADAPTNGRASAPDSDPRV